MFAHAAHCDQTPAGAYPEDWLGRPGPARLRQAGLVHAATRVHDGSDPDAATAEILADPGVVEIHSRTIAYGCYMFAITRER